MKDANEAPSFSDLLGTATKRWQRAEEVMMLRECLGLEFYQVIGCKPEEVQRRQEVYEAALAVMRERWAREDVRDAMGGLGGSGNNASGEALGSKAPAEGPPADPKAGAGGPSVGISAFEGYDALPGGKAGGES